MTDEVSYEVKDYEQHLKMYAGIAQGFVDSFISDMYSKGIIEDVEMEDLQKYLLDPDNNNGILSDITEYFYITTGEIHMMFELLESLPTLDYKVNVFDKPNNHDKYVSDINKGLYKVRYKTLIRDVLKQTGAMGTLTGIWLGDKRNPYPYIFDDPTRVFPSYRKNGDWIVQFDLSLIDEINSDLYRKALFDNLHPYVTEQMYDNYQSGSKGSSRYVSLPQERTFVVHTHKLRRNQRFGTGWANPAMFDVVHKKKMKNVERAIANKVINAIAVLTIGNEKNPDKYGNLQLSKGVRRKIHTGVRAALEKNNQEGISVVSIPEFAKIDFPDVKTDGLDGKKFEHLNTDIQSSVGLSSAVSHGTGGNHASAKVNLEVFYMRVAVLLEQIETDMFQKMINMILPKGQSDNYHIVIDKQKPLTTKEKVDILKGLNDKGWSTKHLVDQIGIDWDQYLEQTLYETEDLNLQKKITPYNTSHTISSKSQGRDEISEDDLTDEGAATRDGGKNDL